MSTENPDYSETSLSIRPDYYAVAVTINNVAAFGVIAVDNSYPGEGRIIIPLKINPLIPDNPLSVTKIGNCTLQNIWGNSCLAIYRTAADTTQEPGHASPELTAQKISEELDIQIYPLPKTNPNFALLENFFKTKN